MRKTTKYTLFDCKRNQDMKKTQNTTNPGKSQQLQTQMDTTCQQNRQTSTPVRCYETPTSGKQKHRIPTEKTSGLLY
jgi:predicted metal-binding protein